MVGTSWWVGLDRQAFAAALRNEELVEHLRSLTHDRKLEPRGREDKPSLKGGRTESAWGEGE